MRTLTLTPRFGRVAIWAVATLLAWLATHPVGTCQQAPPVPPAPLAPAMPNLESLPPDIRLQVEDAIRAARANGHNAVQVQVVHTGTSTTASPGATNCQVRVSAQTGPQAEAGAPQHCARIGGGHCPQVDSIVQQALGELPEGFVAEQGARVKVNCTMGKDADGNPTCEATTTVEPLGQPGQLEVQVRCVATEDAPRCCAQQAQPGCCAPQAQAVAPAGTAPSRQRQRSGLTLAPNPANDHVEVNYEARTRDGDTRLTLATPDGRTVRSISLPAGNGPTRYHLNTQDLPAGTYILRLQNRSLDATQRLVLERQ